VTGNGRFPETIFPVLGFLQYDAGRFFPLLFSVPLHCKNAPHACDAKTAASAHLSSCGYDRGTLHGLYHTYHDGAELESGAETDRPSESHFVTGGRALHHHTYRPPHGMPFLEIGMCRVVSFSSWLGGSGLIRLVRRRHGIDWDDTIPDAE
jgi:hypothetical protein